MSEDLKNHTLTFFLQDLSAPGGTEKVITVWCNHFASLGFPVALVSEPSPSIFFPVDPLVQQSQLDLDADKGIKDNPLVLARRVLACRKWLGAKKNHFLIINKSVYLIPFLVLKIFGLLGSGNRVIYYSHNSASMFENRFSKVVLWFIYKSADLVLCLYHDANYKPKWPAFNPQALPNPCPLTMAAKDLKSLPNKKALYVGRFSQEKGLEIILQAWTELRTKNLLNGWTLILLGDGPCKSQLQKDVANKKLSDCVEIHEPTRDVAPYYQDAGLFLMASVYEGMPLVMLEAKEAGLPVISTLNDGAKYLITDGINGSLVPDRLPGTYAKTLERYLSSDELRYRHAMGSKSSAAEFTLARITQAWLNYLSFVK